MIIKNMFKFNKSNIKTFNEPAKLVEKSTLNFENLLKNIQNSKSYDAYVDCFEDYLHANPKAVRLNENLIKDGEYYIKSEFLEDSNNSKIILEHLKHLNIDMAPEFVNSTSNNMGFAATVMKIKGTEKGEILNFSQNKDSVSALSKKKAYEQLVKLANQNIVNVDILRHPEVLKISEGRIFCEDWSNLCSKNIFLQTYIPEGNVFDILKKIHEIIYK